MTCTPSTSTSWWSSTWSASVTSPGPGREVGEVEAGRLEADLGVLDGVDGRGVDEGQAPPDPHHQAGHRRVGLVARPPADDVDEPADLGTPLVAHGPAHHAGQGDHGVPDGAVGQQALTAVSEAGAHRVGAAHGGAARRPAGGRARPTVVGRIGAVTGGHWRPAVEESGHRTPRVSIRAAPSPPWRGPGTGAGTGLGSSEGSGLRDGRTNGGQPLVDAGRTGPRQPAIAHRRPDRGFSAGAVRRRVREVVALHPVYWGVRRDSSATPPFPCNRGTHPGGRARPTIVTGGRLGQVQARKPGAGGGSPSGPAGGTGGSLGPWTSAIPSRPSPSGPRSGKWLTDNLPDGWGTPGFTHDPGREEGVQPRVDQEALRRGMDLRLMAQGVRRQGPLPDGVGGAQRGVRPGRGAAAGRLLRGHAGGPDHPAVGHRGAEEAVHPRHPRRLHLVVPGVLRARRRQRPGLVEDAGRARRRRMGDQRAEGVDHPGPVRRLHLPAGPHRSRRAQARRHLLPARAR